MFRAHGAGRAAASARGPWAEVSDVLWLQVGSHFCDVRWARPGAGSAHPLDLPQAFSGTVEVSLATSRSSTTSTRFVATRRTPTGAPSTGLARC